MKTNIYTIWIRTGDDSTAGTDSNVFIQLTGTQGQTESIYLPAQDIFAFEAGGTDKFVLEAPDVGDLTRCCVGHDNSEGDSGWYVVDVRVKDDDTDREWLFLFDKWIGLEEAGILYECVSF
ncbi:MAG TPA: PLAT/LH2 domain-containing protein [Phototrophicaceae bacterium]|jgi:hypothetical protein|nr:PLAT/LH2 domain-containing protein [Phototrophicaceae bacterium]